MEQNQECTDSLWAQAAGPKAYLCPRQDGGAAPPLLRPPAAKAMASAETSWHVRHARKQCTAREAPPRCDPSLRLSPPTSPERPVAR